MATRQLVVGGGRRSSAPSATLQPTYVSSAINSPVEGVLHMAGIPGTAGSPNYQPFSEERGPRSIATAMGFGGTPTDWSSSGGAASVSEEAANNLLNDIMAAGLGGANKGVSKEGAQQALAASLRRHGITDLSDIGYVIGEDRIPRFYNRLTGKEIGRRLGNTSGGEGEQEIYLSIDKEGRVLPVNVWQPPDNSTTEDISAIATLAAFAIAPYAVPYLTSAYGALGAVGAPIAAGATYGAGSAALQAGITGGDIGEAALKGAAGGALTAGIGTGMQNLNVGGMIPGASEGLVQGVNTALTKGLTGAALAGLQGGDIGKGLLGGLVAGGIQGALPTATDPLSKMVQQELANMTSRQVVGSPFTPKEIGAAAQPQGYQATAGEQTALNIGNAPVEPVDDALTTGGSAGRTATFRVPVPARVSAV